MGCSQTKVHPHATSSDGWATTITIDDPISYSFGICPSLRLSLKKDQKTSFNEKVLSSLESRHLSTCSLIYSSRAYIMRLNMLPLTVNTNEMRANIKNEYIRLAELKHEQFILNQLIILFNDALINDIPIQLSVLVEKAYQEMDKDDINSTLLRHYVDQQVSTFKRKAFSLLSVYIFSNGIDIIMSYDLSCRFHFSVFYKKAINAVPTEPYKHTLPTLLKL